MGLWDTLKCWSHSPRSAATGLLLLVATLALGGCETKGFFDPTEMGRFQRTPKIVQILRNLNVGIDEPNDVYVNATEVREDDLKPVQADYTIGKNDLVQITITDLAQQGVETQKTVRVTESGNISLPYIGQVQAAGKTEAQLEQAIIQDYKDRQVLTNAQVSVVTVEARNRAFTIGGAVQRPGQYQIPEADFRLTDAMVLAGGATSFTGIDYIYVHRHIEQDEKVSGETPAAAPGAAPTSQPGPDILAPRSALPVKGPRLLQTAGAQPTSEPAGAEGRTVIINNQPVQIPSGPNAPLPQGATPATPQEPGMAPPTSEKGFEFNELKEPGDIRIIRVPFIKLTNGELKYNIVIRPMDFIDVPQPAVGEYYMGGHVQRTGVYSLTAREITLQQAVISAGMLDQLAIPERTEIVRRISPTREVYSRVNLAKIFAGEEPDIMLKPDDQVRVGSNALAPFLAAFRAGFRITYGFGFIYDRNFNNVNNGQGG